MKQAKVGDTCDLSTVTYVSEINAQQFRVPQTRPGRPTKRECSMFEDKESTSMQLICSENPNKEFNYMINQEYSMLREKQEMKAHQAEILKAKEQELKDAVANDKTAIEESKGV